LVTLEITRPISNEVEKGSGPRLKDFKNQFQRFVHIGSIMPYGTLTEFVINEI